MCVTTTKTRHLNRLGQLSEFEQESNTESQRCVQCSDGEQQQSSGECRFDMGEHFQARHGIDWQFNGANSRRIADSGARTGDDVYTLKYHCLQYRNSGLRYCRCAVLLHDGLFVALQWCRRC